MGDWESVRRSRPREFYHLLITGDFWCLGAKCSPNILQIMRENPSSSEPHLLTHILIVGVWGGNLEPQWLWGNLDLSNHKVEEVQEVQVKRFLLKLIDSDQQWEELTSLFWIFSTWDHFLSFLSYPYAKTQDRKWSWHLGYKSHHTVETQNSLVKTHWHCLWTLIKWQLYTLLHVREKKILQITRIYENKTFCESKAE